MTICERLFKIMNQKGVKAVQIAEKLNISQSVISNWRKRNTNPPIEYALDICEVLNISLYELLGGEENELTADEQQLLEDYRKCNEGNKQFILNAVAGLSNQDNKQTQELETKSSDLKIG